MKQFGLAFLALTVATTALGVTRQVTTTDELLAALEDTSNDVIELTADEYVLRDELTLSRAVTVRGVNGYKNHTLRQSTDGKRGVVLSHKDARLEGVTVTGVKAPYNTNGGAVSMSKGTVYGCRLTGNIQTSMKVRGLGAYLTGGTISHSVIDQNGFNYSGTGGVSNGWTPTGAGLYINGNNVVVESCLIANNTSESSYTNSDGGRGAGVYVTDKTGVQILNSTITGNIGLYTASGLCLLGSDVTVRNCIIAGNIATSEQEEFKSDGFPNWRAADPEAWAANVSYCLWGEDGDCRSIGEHSSLADPGFNDSDGGDYTLARTSPAVCAGVSYDGLPADLNGVARLNPPDLGCYQSAHVVCATTVTPEKAIQGSTFTLTGVLSSGAVGADYDCYWRVEDAAGAIREIPGRGTTVEAADLPAGDYRVWVAMTNRNDASDFGLSCSNGRLFVAPLTNYVTSVAGAVPIRPYATPETAATSVQDALEIAWSGAVVQLDAGEHLTDKAMVLSNNIVVCGAGREATILRMTSKNIRLVELNCAAARVEHMTLTGAYSTSMVGACVYVDAEGGQVVDCRLMGNTVCAGMREGSAVYANSAYALFDRCDICCNTNITTFDWSWVKDVVHLRGGVMRNSLVRHNYIAECDIKGSGHVVWLQDSASVENCTIVDNFDGGIDGCAVYMYNGGVRLVNTVMARNSFPKVTSREAALPNLRRIWWEPENCPNNLFVGSDIYEGSSSFTADDAGFADADNGDYHLAPKSPCLRKGLPQDWMQTSLDLDGKVRIFNGKVDIGCYARKRLGLTLLVR